MFERQNREREEEVNAAFVQDSGRCRNKNPSDPPNTGSGGWGAGALSLSENSPFWVVYFPRGMVGMNMDSFRVTGKEPPPSVLCL